MESIITAFFTKTTVENIGFLFMGVCLCLWYLQSKMNLFDKNDRLVDTLKEVTEVLERCEKMLEQTSEIIDAHDYLLEYKKRAKRKTQYNDIRSEYNNDEPPTQEFK
jgi:hypothetical protein